MWIYLIIGLVTMSVFQLFAGSQIALTKTKSVFVGGTASTIASQWFTVYTSTESYLRASYSGSFGAGGYFMLSGLIMLLSVWVFNLFSTRRYLVV